MAEQLKQTNKVTLYNVYIKIIGYGQIKETCKKEEVRKICELYRNKLEPQKGKEAKNMISIQVLNKDTGEIREYWNNRQNKTLF